MTETIGAYILKQLLGGDWAIWFNEPDWETCKCFELFTREKQARERINYLNDMVAI